MGAAGRRAILRLTGLTGVTGDRLQVVLPKTEKAVPPFVFEEGQGKKLRDLKHNELQPMKIFRPILAAIALCAAVSAGAQDKPSKYEMRAGWMASVANILLNSLRAVEI